jgi:hypothetical protein
MRERTGSSQPAHTDRREQDKSWARSYGRHLGVLYELPTDASAPDLEPLIMALASELDR